MAIPQVVLALMIYGVVIIILTVVMVFFSIALGVGYRDEKNVIKAMQVFSAIGGAIIIAWYYWN